MRKFFHDHEYFWNAIIKWAVKHLHRAGGVHQDTFYCILEKCNKSTVKAQIKHFEKNYNDEGWNK